MLRGKGVNATREAKASGAAEAAPPSRSRLSIFDVIEESWTEAERRALAAGVDPDPPAPRDAKGWH